MNSTVLQIPMKRDLRDLATAKAIAMGFSSLQEVVRVFLNRVASGETNITFEQSVQLSDRAARRYDKMIDEIESGKANLKTFTDTSSLMKYLNED